MNNSIEVVFVMGGVSKLKKTAYLQVSDGIEAKFCNLSKGFRQSIDDSTFASYSKGDSITLSYEVKGLDVVVTGVL